MCIEKSCLPVTTPMGELLGVGGLCLDLQEMLCLPTLHPHIGVRWVINFSRKVSYFARHFRCQICQQGHISQGIEVVHMLYVIGFAWVVCNPMKWVWQGVADNL